MAHDPLATLIKVRQLACDEAQKRVVEALGSESRAERAAHDIDRAIALEIEAASNPDSSDAVVDVLAAWLPKARRELATARQTLTDRQAETVRSRAELTACRTALETVEALQQQRRDHEHSRREKIFERDLEDRPYQPPTHSL